MNSYQNIQSLKDRIHQLKPYYNLDKYDNKTNEEQILVAILNRLLNNNKTSTSKTNSSFYVKKVSKEKAAVRVSSEKDIPDFLKKTIIVKDNEISSLNAEGAQHHIPLGSVLGYEKTDKTSTGYGAWPLGKDSFIEKSGKFYSAPSIRIAQKITAPFAVDTPWGREELKSGEEGYLITMPDGSKNILNIGTPSAKDYMVCKKDGTEIMPLIKFHDTKNTSQVTYRNKQKEDHTGLGTDCFRSDKADHLFSSESDAEEYLKESIDNKEAIVKCLSRLSGLTSDLYDIYELGKNRYCVVINCEFQKYLNNFLYWVKVISKRQSHDGTTISVTFECSHNKAIKLRELWSNYFDPFVICSHRHYMKYKSEYDCIMMQDSELAKEAMCCLLRDTSFISNPQNIEIITGSDIYLVFEKLARNGVTSEQEFQEYDYNVAYRVNNSEDIDGIIDGLITHDMYYDKDPDDPNYTYILIVFTSEDEYCEKDYIYKKLKPFFDEVKDVLDESLIIDKQSLTESRSYLDIRSFLRTFFGSSYNEFKIHDLGKNKYIIEMSDLISSLYGYMLTRVFKTRAIKPFTKDYHHSSQYEIIFDQDKARKLINLRNEYSMDLVRKVLENGYSNCVGGINYINSYSNDLEKCAAYSLLNTEEGGERSIYSRISITSDMDQIYNILKDTSHEISLEDFNVAYKIPYNDDEDELCDFGGVIIDLDDYFPHAGDQTELLDDIGQGDYIYYFNCVPEEEVSIMINNIHYEEAFLKEIKPVLNESFDSTLIESEEPSITPLDLLKEVFNECAGVFSDEYKLYQLRNNTYSILLDHTNQRMNVLKQFICYYFKPLSIKTIDKGIYNYINVTFSANINKIHKLLELRQKYGQQVCSLSHSHFNNAKKELDYINSFNDDIEKTAIFNLKCLVILDDDLKSQILVSSDVAGVCKRINSLIANPNLHVNTERYNVVYRIPASLYNDVDTGSGVFRTDPEDSNYMYWFESISGFDIHEAMDQINQISKFLNDVQSILRESKESCTSDDAETLETLHESNANRYQDKLESLEYFIQQLTGLEDKFTVYVINKNTYNLIFEEMYSEDIISYLLPWIRIKSSKIITKGDTTYRSVQFQSDHSWDSLSDLLIKYRDQFQQLGRQGYTWYKKKIEYINTFKTDEEKGAMYLLLEGTAAGDDFKGDLSILSVTTHVADIGSRLNDPNLDMYLYNFVYTLPSQVSKYFSSELHVVLGTKGYIIDNPDDSNSVFHFNYIHSNVVYDMYHEARLSYHFLQKIQRFLGESMPLDISESGTEYLTESHSYDDKIYLDENLFYESNANEDVLSLLNNAILKTSRRHFERDHYKIYLIGKNKYNIIYDYGYHEKMQKFLYWCNILSERIIEKDHYISVVFYINPQLLRFLSGLTSFTGLDLKCLSNFGLNRFEAIVQHVNSIKEDTVKAGTYLLYDKFAKAKDTSIRIPFESIHDGISYCTIDKDEIDLWSQKLPNRQILNMRNIHVAFKFRISDTNSPDEIAKVLRLNMLCETVFYQQGDDLYVFGNIQGASVSLLLEEFETMRDLFTTLRYYKGDLNNGRN